MPDSNNQLMSRGMTALLIAQFLSAMADNVLFVAAIAMLKTASGGDSLLPLVQATFVLAFIFFAPYVGPFADAWPKGRVMFRANLVKLTGAALILGGLHPLAGYAIVGLGAAAYSPAKYGILTQLVGEGKLVKANGLLEGSTIAAILLGVMLGGWLADYSSVLAVQVVAGLYLGAAAVNLLIPKLAAIKPLVRGEVSRLPLEFLRDMKTLLRNPDARFSIFGTSLFWGMGASLRLLLFAWVPVALGLADNQSPAALMGMVSVGIVVGASLAALTVKLSQVNRALIGGLAIGPLLWLLAPLHGFAVAGAVLLGIGAAGGFFAIPLNALLQERGHESVGTGRALAVQNFFENLAMLLMAGLYFAAIAAGMTPRAAVLVFGLLVLAGMLLISWGRLRKPAFTVRTAEWRQGRDALSAIRRQVFIQEQSVPEDMEWDEHDEAALHFLVVSADGSTVGCARLLSDGRFGRMAVLAAWRKKGAGRVLLQAVLSEAHTRGHAIIRLSAQTHAAAFYARYGFESEGDEYSEAGIPHVAMTKTIGRTGN
jgi:LPLT family lysophospholipid transporter-like MFS transporter